MATGFGECRLCGSLLDAQLEHGETCNTAEATRVSTVHAFTPSQEGEDSLTQESPRNPKDSQKHNADLFTTAALPGRSAALDVCVACFNAAAARGDAAQAAFDCKNSHYRRGISDLCRPLVRTADGRPHRAVTRTLQYAADIARHRLHHQTANHSHPYSKPVTVPHAPLAGDL